jgi:hypothetical protein
VGGNGEDPDECRGALACRSAGGVSAFVVGESSSLRSARVDFLDLLLDFAPGLPFSAAPLGGARDFDLAEAVDVVAVDVVVVAAAAVAVAVAAAVAVVVAVAVATLADAVSAVFVAASTG